MNRKSVISAKNSRTTNTLFNFTSSMGGQFITILMHFIVRTVFINTLGKSYLGIGGLFSNILQMLSLAEFGVGSAIIYKLYEPLAKKDTKRIAVLMKFYKTVYRFIGLGVLLIGAILVPFLPVLIKDYGKLEALHINAAFIFMLYLMKTVSSYLFFAYKSAIIKADQKQYLITVISYFFTFGTTVLQIISLIVTRNFTIYVLIMIVNVIGLNIVCAKLADRMYPYINDRNTGSLPKEEVWEVFKDCGALFLYKLNGVVLKATDNIVLSVFLGLEMVAVYSNYYVLYTTLNSLFSHIFNSVSHSLGNLHASENEEKQYKIFKSTFLITAILGGTAGVGIFVVSNELVYSWIGEEWVLPQPFALLMGLEVFTLAFRLSISKFRTTMGLFQQAKFRPVAGMIINLVVSVALVNALGIVGVLIGTVVADWTTTMWFDPIIIHKYGYRNKFPVRNYFFKLLKYLLTSCLAGAIAYLICTHFMTGHGWLTVIVHAAIVVLIAPTALIASAYGTEEGSYVAKMALKSLKKVVRRVKK